MAIDRIPLVDESGNFMNQEVLTRLQEDLGGSVTAAAGTPQADYVERFSRASAYGSVTVKKTSAANQLEVSCRAPNGEHVTYHVTPGPRYQFVGYVWAGGSGAIATDAKFPTLTLTGTWNTASTPYTTEVGATFTARTSTVAPGATVSIGHHADNRGGVWRLSLVEDPSVTVDYSTWRATSGGTRTDAVLTIPEPGNWTIKGEFIGDDPANVPSSGAGTARGWLTLSQMSLGPIAVYDPGAPKKDHRLSVVSNKDFALRIAPVGGATQFVPYHGQETEVQASPPRYLDGTTPIDIAGMGVDDIVHVESFEIVQNIYGVNPAAPGTNLVNVWTKQRFSPDGTYSVDGAWRTLVDVQGSESMYHMMLTADPAVFDTVASAVNRGYPNTATQVGTNTFMDLEHDTATGFTFLSSTTPDYVAAVRYNNPEETIRRGQDGKRAANRRVWIEHRDGQLSKIYSSLYAAGTVIPAGTVHRFSGDYFYGKVPGAYHVMNVL